jgi:hypothetical protein
VNQPFDPFETLRDLNPVDPADLRGVASMPEAQRALESILADRRTQAWRFPRRLTHRPLKRTIALALIPITACVAVAAWALTQGPSKQLTIGCYAAANLHARTVIVPAGSASAIRTCAAVWSRGEFGPARQPRLEACVLSSGAVGVFPSRSGHACRRLKLAPLAPGTPTVSASAVALLKRGLVRTFIAMPCMTKVQATTTVRAELRRLQLGQWDVQTNGSFSAARPCAGLAFDEERKIVLLVPTPRRP